MSDPLFQKAYARARSRFSDSGWLSLSPREITEAIYGEIRQIDAERVAMQPPVNQIGQVKSVKKVIVKGATKPPIVGGIDGKPRAKVAAAVSP